MMCRGAAADVIVMALVGERGREVGEFLEVIGDEGRKRSVIVVSTSNEPPLMRLRASLLATAIAEAFAAEGKHVLLVVDSLTRFAMAQREIGLAAGEPPTAKGYTPSVLNKLARLVERAGRFREGSITAFYTVLMEGDDQQDPVVDTVRSLLDGHIILDRRLATKGHYPPIAVLDSLSRLMPSVVGPEHLKKVTELRQLLAAMHVLKTSLESERISAEAMLYLIERWRCSPKWKHFSVKAPRACARSWRRRRCCPSYRAKACDHPILSRSCSACGLKEKRSKSASWQRSSQSCSWPKPNSQVYRPSWSTSQPHVWTRFNVSCRTYITRQWRHVRESFGGDVPTMRKRLKD